MVRLALALCCFTAVGVVGLAHINGTQGDAISLEEAKSLLGGCVGVKSVECVGGMCPGEVYVNDTGVFKERDADPGSIQDTYCIRTVNGQQECATCAQTYVSCGSGS